jgi:hypothetical protein
VNANGLYDMDRRIRRAGVEYQRIMRDWNGTLASGGADIANVRPDA